MSQGDYLPSRWQFTPFWKLTNWGFLFRRAMTPALWPGRGCDEWHNRPRYFILPLVGMVVRWGRDSTLEGPHHVWAHGPGGWEGIFVSDCAVCQEIVESFHTVVPNGREAKA